MIVDDIIKNIGLIKEGTDNLSRGLLLNHGDLELFDSNSLQLKLFNNNINLVAKVLGDFQYNNEQSPNETKHLHGVVAVDKNDIFLIEEINANKTLLRDLYSRANFRKNKKLKESLKDRINIDRFCAKQIYRHIPMFDGLAQSVSFSMCKTKSIKSIGWQEAYDLVERVGEGANVDRDKSYLLSNYNKQFALVTTPKKHMRANIRVGSGSDATQKQIKCSLPLFVYSKNGSLPKVHKPFVNTKERRKRKNEYLSVDPVLKSINAHEYIKEKSGKW